MASQLSALIITTPESPTPRKQAMRRTTVFQNKDQKHRVTTPSIQLGKAERSLLKGHTHSAAAIGPMHHR
jgi:hypothetical protein